MVPFPPFFLPTPAPRTPHRYTATMSTKRMNLEEKRKVILGIYHATKDVFVEKEILSLGK